MSKDWYEHWIEEGGKEPGSEVSGREVSLKTALKEGAVVRVYPDTKDGGEKKYEGTIQTPSREGMPIEFRRDALSEQNPLHGKEVMRIVEVSETTWQEKRGALPKYEGSSLFVAYTTHGRFWLEVKPQEKQ